MEVQTRDESGELRFFKSLKEAMAYANENNQVWKVSFGVGNGERVRLVRVRASEFRTEDDLWVFESMDSIIEEATKKRASL